MFRARLPPNFITPHKMPRLPRNLHLATTSRSPAIAICKKHATQHVLSAVPATKKWSWTRPKCCACHEECNTFSENRAKVLPLPRKTSFDTSPRPHVTKCHACHAKRSYATRPISKNDPSWNPSYRHGHRSLVQAL